MRADFTLCVWTDPREASQAGSEALEPDAGPGGWRESPSLCWVICNGTGTTRTEKKAMSHCQTSREVTVRKGSLWHYFQLLPMLFFPREANSSATEKEDITLEPGVWPWGS